MKLLKKPIPESIEEYCKIRKEADKNWYRWTNDALGYMIFEQKRTTKSIEWKETKEWLEFIKLYREINKNGSYAKTLLRKYELVLKENKHEDIIKNLKQYKEHLILFPSKPALQVSTYLNQNRFKDDWELIKTDFASKWQDDRLKELKVPVNCIDPIKTEIQAWESKHGAMREMTIGILDQIIWKYYTIRHNREV